MGDDTIIPSSQEDEQAHTNTARRTPRASTQTSKDTRSDYNRDTRTHKGGDELNDNNEDDDEDDSDKRIPPREAFDSKSLFELFSFTAFKQIVNCFPKQVDFLRIHGDAETQSIHLLGMEPDFAVIYHVYLPSSYFSHLRLVQNVNLYVKLATWKTDLKMNADRQQSDFTTFVEDENEFIINIYPFRPQQNVLEEKKNFNETKLMIQKTEPPKSGNNLKLKRFPLKFSACLRILSMTAMVVDIELATFPLDGVSGSINIEFKTQPGLGYIEYSSVGVSKRIIKIPLIPFTEFPNWNQDDGVSYSKTFQKTSGYPHFATLVPPIEQFEAKTYTFRLNFLRRCLQLKSSCRRMRFFLTNQGPLLTCALLIPENRPKLKKKNKRSRDSFTNDHDDENDENEDDGDDDDNENRNQQPASKRLMNSTRKRSQNVSSKSNTTNRVSTSSSSKKGIIPKTMNKSQPMINKMFSSSSSLSSSSASSSSSSSSASSSSSSSSLSSSFLPLSPMNHKDSKSMIVSQPKTGTTNHQKQLYSSSSSSLLPSSSTSLSTDPSQTKTSPAQVHPCVLDMFEQCCTVPHIKITIIASSSDE